MSIILLIILSTNMLKLIFLLSEYKKSIELYFTILFILFKELIPIRNLVGIKENFKCVSNIIFLDSLHFNVCDEK